MYTSTDINNIVTYLGGPDSNSQINTARILLNTGYPNFALNGWESPGGLGKIYGAMVDSIAGSILTGPVNGYTDATPSNPSHTNSTTGVMMGLAVTYIPTRSGIVMVQVEGQMQTDTANDGAQASLYYGTAPAPSNGAALTGTQKGKPAIVDSFPASAKRWQFGITTVISGLTVGTTYWFDLALMAITGGYASLTGLEFVVTEQ